MSKLVSPIFIALAFIVFITACKDDDDKKAKSRTDYLTQHSWVLQKAELTANGLTTAFPADSLQPACTLDDVITFSTDFKCKQATGSDNCGGLETEQTGTWAWNNSQDTLSYTLNDNTLKVSIDVLNDTTLRVGVGQYPMDTNGDGKPDLFAMIMVTFIKPE